jgi:ATP-dependent DNA helicase RecG
MPSALETLVKILKLEQDTGLQDKAVIGGLKSFAEHWAQDAHAQAKKPEHHALVDELAGVLNGYSESDERAEAIRYMIGRIMGRIPPPAGIAPRAIELPTVSPQNDPSANTQQSASPSQSAQARPPRRDDPEEIRRRREANQQRAAQQRAQQEQQGSQDNQQGEQVEDEGQRSRGQDRPQERQPDRRDQKQEYRPENKQGDRREDRRDDRRDDRQRQDKGKPRHHEQQPVSRALPENFNEADPFGFDPNYENGESASHIEPEEEPQNARTVRPSRRKRSDNNVDRDLNVFRSLRGSVASINGIGPKMAEKLEQLGVFTIEELLYLFPRRYDDYTQMLPLSRLTPNQTVTVVGTVRNNIVIKGKRGVDILNVTIDDGTGILTASFFGQPYLRSKLERGTQVVFSGKTDLFRGQIAMSNPEWELLEREALHTRAIVPIYPLTKGLSAHNIRRFTRSALDQWANQFPDFIPESVLERMDLPDLSWAIQNMHYPASNDALESARRRLSFDELIMLQLGVLGNRREWQSVPAESITVTDEWLTETASAMPFPLTGAQARAIQAIREDMARTVPMNRLLQGDVGAGKTAVAAISMAVAVNGGFQAAIMAPTSILAEQHYRGIGRLLQNIPGGSEVNIKLLTGSTSAQERSETLWGLGEGTVHIIVGTHALLEDTVNFKNLGFVVIDEQHRFGVEQRGKLRSKGQNPHVLVMTATPIPRTLALTMYADLDLTILDEMPPGRTPIETRVLYGNERERAYSFIDSQLNKGRQAFVVYPLVEASDSEALSDLKSAVEEAERLQNEVFPKRRIGLLHGRMSPSEKDEVMAAFSSGETEILVSTSVVEVGIDVPNASVMMIEGANRFGLAQLHQFRGRVGRGQHQSYCLLIAEDGGDTNERLKAMEATSDGFELAEIDWKLRGAGELLGTRQSGGMAHMGEFMDPKLVSEAQIEAKTLYEEDPYLSAPEHTLLRVMLNERYGNKITDVS